MRPPSRGEKACERRRKEGELEVREDKAGFQRQQPMPEVQGQGL